MREAARNEKDTHPGVPNPPESGGGGFVRRPLWGLLGCPMPTPELRFRQLEDRRLVPHSKIVYLWENPFPVRTTSSGEPRHIVIGRSGGPVQRGISR